MAETIFNYFPALTGKQKEQLEGLQQIYVRWNSMINVISRKDMDNFMVHHVLHSLAVAKIIDFAPNSRILDVGTGGGFPGIPLAIIFPDSQFSLLDSIEKKIKVVSAVAEELELNNIIPIRRRVEEENGKYHFIISRAVTEFPGFVKMTLKNIDKPEFNSLRNGILYLKGGDLAIETELFKERLTVWSIKDFFNEPFFDTKKILHLTK
ncbi:MAG: 16S rRNA (guanine(527)-N(7))-methyltransferase RsmG [Bacteroidales bacterium]|nr:16S rRNA (guanine(527)-N(7))-methyltransferase RsmG [Bacteroidales bacterium]MBK8882899.1 16S rRNA (guanine(527)-N(7))-methyltransferase RsmG [Bacteroidales bacterium]